jgi:hypothetical protein
VGKGNHIAKFWLDCGEWIALDLRHAVPPEFPRTLVLDLGKMRCSVGRESSQSFN